MDSVDHIVPVMLRLMLDESLIRARAYKIWERRVRSGDEGDAVSDWLLAERVEFARAANKAIAGLAGLNQDSVWDIADALSQLIMRLSRRERGRRMQSFLVGECERFQEFMTKPDSENLNETDLDVEKAARSALRIYRVALALRLLQLDGGDDETHSLEKEFGDLFSNQEATHDTALFSLSIAAIVQHQVGKPVVFLEESRKKNQKRPDFMVPGLAYFECKKVQCHSKDNVPKSISDNLTKAVTQLSQEQERSPLPYAGACIELPLKYFPPGPSAFAMIAEYLRENAALDFVVVAVSGTETEDGVVRFPIARQVLVSDARPIPDDLLRIGSAISIESEQMRILTTQDVARYELLKLDE